MHLDEAAKMVWEEAHRLWPDETTEQRGLALAEEAGEVCRAILKRAEHTRKNPAYWTENLKLELAQVVGIALALLYDEGWSADFAFNDALEELKAKEPDPQ